MRHRSTALYALLLGAPASAQVAVPDASRPSVPSRIAAKTIVSIEIAATLDSRSSKIGDMFPVRLAEAVLDTDGKILLPAGISGEGEVIHSARSGMAGRAGELIVTVRYLQCGPTRVPLGRFRFGEAGADRSKTAASVNAAAAGASVLAPLAGAGSVFALMITGGEVQVPVGARATAHVVTDVDLAAELAGSCEPRIQ